MEEPNASGRGKNKRFWSAEEDKALISALSELAANPHWKSRNGFKNGYMVRLEEVLGETIPDCGLRASPHIDSRLKTLVAKFKAILQMLGTKGFKWDDKQHMISVKRSFYDEYCKAHPNCKNLYGFSFPHLYEMMRIYGNDYASGKPPWVLADAVANTEKDTSAQLILYSSDDDDDASDSSSPPSKKTKRGKRSANGGVKKASDNATSLSGPEQSTLQDVMGSVSGHLSTMASVMKRAGDRELDIARKSEKVLDEILSLEGVTPDDALKAADIVMSQPSRVMLFFKCPTALRIRYVNLLLARRGDA